MLHITSIRHSYPEKGPFCIDRKQGYAGYTFLHFYNSMEILINGKIITTRPHACILYAPSTKQYFKTENNMAHDWFHFSTEDPLPEGILCDTIYYPSDHSVITAIIREMENEYFSRKSHYHKLIELKALELFVKIIRTSNHEAVPAVSHQLKKDFSALRTYVFSHLDEHWTVEKMAKRVNLSTSHFHSLYRTLYGKSPMDDLIVVRCNAAHVALVYSTEPMASIAKRLGYNNIYHFIRQFRSIFNITPGALRKNHADVPLWVVPPQKTTDSNSILSWPAGEEPWKK